MHGRSRLLDRAIDIHATDHAVLLVADGLGWMTSLVPPLATSIFPAIAAVAGAAEFALLLWMLIVGVNSDRWLEQARASTLAAEHALEP